MKNRTVLFHGFELKPTRRLSVTIKEASSAFKASGQPFKDFLAEQMRDPEFRAAYEEISAEENAKLKALQFPREN